MFIIHCQLLVPMTVCEQFHKCSIWKNNYPVLDKKCSSTAEKRYAYRTDQKRILNCTVVSCPLYISYSPRLLARGHLQSFCIHSICFLTILWQLVTSHQTAIPVSFNNFPILVRNTLFKKQYFFYWRLLFKIAVSSFRFCFHSLYL